ncbi:MAG: hypothetical protein IT381_04665 [Deltaproteobacteria bacterium]|nr:hypothetical protein [Deltaproteobacteria bacterium]
MHDPQLATERSAPQLSSALAGPQLLFKRVQKTASLSAMQVQTLAIHGAASQSRSSAQPLPRPHTPQALPPQSTSVSPLLRMPSAQVGTPFKVVVELWRKRSKDTQAGRPTQAMTMSAPLIA